MELSAETVQKCRELAGMLRRSTATVALAGAGLSTESGIPDFRTPGSGLYAKFSPEVFSLDRFNEDPAYFYDFAREWFKVLRESTPNRGHLALAALHKAGLIHRTVTQNIDGFEFMAGCRPVDEIHGHLRTFHCTSCGHSVDFATVAARLEESRNLPCCLACTSGIYKPDVVFFGEQLPGCFADALREARRAELFLVLGSSLTVQPAAMLPVAGENSTVIINYSQTPLDGTAQLIINDSLGAVLELTARFAGALPEAEQINN